MLHSVSQIQILEGKVFSDQVIVVITDVMLRRELLKAHAPMHCGVE